MKPLYTFIITLCVCTLAWGQDDLLKRYAESITPQDLERHLRIVAADSMEGRDTGSKGQKKAMNYVIGQYKALGLAAISPDESGQKSYRQPYNLYRRGWGEVYLANEKQQYKLQQDFYMNGLLNVLSEEKVPVVFAGYGIEEDSYNDYKNLNVKDKAVLILEGEPKKADGGYWISGDKNPSTWSKFDNAWTKKVSLAREKGAKYILMVSKEEGEKFEQLLKGRGAMGQRIARQRLSTKPIAEKVSGEAAMVVSKDMALQLLNIKAKKWSKAVEKIGTTGQTTAGSLPERQISLKAERKDEVINTENVVAYIEGTDKKDELIIISAHLDHIGISSDGQINNGADDDGSGTVSLLELAEAFMKAKADGHGPRRSIMFLNVTGEEKGLLGSAYYAANPVIPLAQTVCDLNIDMIGRVDDAHKNNHNYTYVIGSDKLSSELHKISEEANAKSVNIKMDYTFNDPADPNRFYYRSDHYNFAVKKVPIIFYFTGVHEDYHKPGDDVEKILFDKQAKIVQLVFYTAWELANREERIKVDSNKP